MSTPTYTELLDENIRLRAALARSDQPCAYCSLSAEDFNRCVLGFPGCSRADDAMGCPELGAALELQQLKDVCKELQGDVVYFSDIAIEARRVEVNNGKNREPWREAVFRRAISLKRIENG